MAEKKFFKQKRGAKVKKKKEKGIKELTIEEKLEHRKKLETKKQEKVSQRVKDIKAVHARFPAPKNVHLDEAPKVVVVFGPPKTGKSTLIRTLVKNFSKQRLGTIKGPITTVAGKSNRITFIECSRDINAMLDCSKIADAVIFVVDGSSGIEMETMEMAELCQTHGKPKLFGFVTHLDVLETRSAQNKTKNNIRKKFKSAFSTPLSFFFATSTINDGKEYLNASLEALGHKLMALKSIPRQWRDSNPFIIVDKIKFDAEINDENDNCAAELFGFVRGQFLKQNQLVLMPGVGQFTIGQIEALNDPCPLDSKHKKRSLLESEHYLYAPMLEYHAVNRHEIVENADDPDDKTNLQMEAVKQLKNERKQQFRLFDDEEGVNDENDDDLSTESEYVSSDSEMSEMDIPEDLMNSNTAHQKSANIEQFGSKDAKHVDPQTLMNQILDQESEICSDNAESEDLGIFFEQIIEKGTNSWQRISDQFVARDFKDEESVDEDDLSENESIGTYNASGINDSDHENSSDAENIGDSSDDSENENEGVKDSDSEAIDAPETVQIANNDAVKIDEAKHKNTKHPYIANLIDKAESQEKIDSEFLQSSVGKNESGIIGVKVGTYVKISIKNLPIELYEMFDGSQCLILAGLSDNQRENSIVKTRINLHPLQKKPLRTNIPSMISMGWHRIQSAATFCSQAVNLSLRYLKYTPKAALCYAGFSSPIYPQRTGMCIYSMNEKFFRIMATGSVVGIDDSINIRKKLKLIGTPTEIYNKTAIIKGLFNSKAETAKFEGAKVQTVSGIRGIVKRHTKGSPGTVRVTFEDQISPSDIVFLKSWNNVEVMNDCLVIPNLLMNHESLVSWKGLSDIEEYQKFAPKASNPKSNYSENVERTVIKPKVVHLPPKVRKSLPFKLNRISNSKEPADVDIDKLFKLKNEQKDNHEKTMTMLNELKKEKKHAKLNKIAAYKKSKGMAMKKKSDSEMTQKEILKKVRGVLKLSSKK